MPRTLLRQLHQRSAGRHLVVAVRQFAILGACTWGLVRFPQPLIWVPLAIVQGWTIFNFTVLLHEVVHGAVFARRRAAAERWLGFLCATPALFPIYFRAARRESATYPPEVRTRIGAERRVSMAAHLIALGLLAWLVDNRAPHTNWAGAPADGRR